MKLSYIYKNLHNLLVVFISIIRKYKYSFRHICALFQLQGKIQMNNSLMECQNFLLIFIFACS